jgi:hypothetical protein
MNLLVTLTLSPTSTRPFGLHKGSIRRASGLVQTGIIGNLPTLTVGPGNLPKTRLYGRSDRKSG